MKNTIRNCQYTAAQRRLLKRQARRKARHSVERDDGFDPVDLERDAFDYFLPLSGYIINPAYREPVIPNPETRFVNREPMPDTNPLDPESKLNIEQLLLAIVVGPVIFGGLLVVAVFVKRYFNL